MSENERQDTNSMGPELERNTETQAPEDDIRDQSMRVNPQEEHVNPNIQMGTRSPGLSPRGRSNQPPDRLSSKR